MAEEHSADNDWNMIAGRITLGRTRIGNKIVGRKVVGRTMVGAKPVKKFFGKTQLAEKLPSRVLRALLVIAKRTDCKRTL